MFREAAPGETLDYSFTIPADHRGGTFWYHPHIHGATAQQVWSGLAGAIVIEGELDRIPEIAEADEQVLVVHDVTIGRNGAPNRPGRMDLMRGREGQMVTVNGALEPTLRLRRGGRLRLRIVNACASRYLRLAVQSHTMYELPRAMPTPEVLLVPGDRVEFLVRGDQAPGDYRLMNLPYDRGGGMGMMRQASTSGALATLRYTEGTTALAPLPGELPAEPPPTGEWPQRTVTLGGAMMSFTIDGRVYDMDRIDARAALGSIEEWEVRNVTNMDHPFHLHTYAFQAADGDGTWHDTISVPAFSSRKLFVRFAGFAGIMPYHCHILDHADLGMMANLEVV